MTVLEAAAALGCSTQRVYALLATGRLAGTRKEGVRGWESVDADSVAGFERRTGGRPRKARQAPQDRPQRPKRTNRALVADYRTVTGPGGAVLGHTRRRCASFDEDGGYWEVRPAGQGWEFSGHYDTLDAAVAALEQGEVA